MIDASIIIPTYNREQTVIRAIDSCIKDNNLTIEVLVVDDGSTDNTQQTIINEYPNWQRHEETNGFKLAQANKSIRYIHQDNAGAPAARNNGLKRATGTYIKFLDSDDLLVDDALEKEFNTAQAQSAEALLTGWIELAVDDEGKPLSEKKVPAPDLSNGIDDMLEGKGPCASAGFYRRSRISSLSWDESITKAQDWMWAWTVCLSGIKFSTLDIPSSCYIQYNNEQRITQTGNSLLRSTQARLTILNKVEDLLIKKQLLNEERARKLAMYYYKDARIVCQLDKNDWIDLYNRIIGLDKDFNPVEKQRVAKWFNRLFGVKYGVINLVRLKKVVNSILN